jgi:hypothetical protein
MILATIAALLALQAEPPAAPPATTPPAAPQTEPKPEPKTEPEPRTPPTTEPATKPTTPPTTPPITPPITPPTTEPTPPATPDAAPTTPAGAAPTTPAGTAPTTPPPAEVGANTPINPAGIPNEAALPVEAPKRAYLVVDRVSVAAGIIESDDDAIIVLRDDKGRIKSFAKNRLISVTYLLEGPAGRRVRVVFNDGRVIVGSLIEDGYQHVELEISGIKTKYPREAVAAVRPYPTDRELYEGFRTTLEPDQYGARYTLAVWLYNKKMYAESKTELESLLEATNHYDAKKLLNEVNAQLALMDDAGGGVDRPVESGGSSRERPVSPRTTGILASPLLSDADVNLIRVYELDVANPPRLQVSPSLIRTMLDKYSDSDLIPAKSAEKNAFFSKEPVEIVKTLFALKARELYGEIRVLGEPEPLNLFRLRVHNAWLIGNCATSKCHGGADAGRFFLHNREWKDDNVRYTNMLILLRTRIDTLPLIDPEKPTDSLIFQYALPKTEARRPHPDVRGWSPVLTSGRRGLQEDFVDWIRSMRLPRGDYPIDYTPPALKSPDRPAETGPDR